MNVNPNLYPKGGFFFQEADGAKIFGDTWAGVEIRVANYRKRAGYPPGNPHAEVLAQACQRNPEICTEDNPAYHHQLSKATLKTKVLMWLATLQRKLTSEPPQFSFAEVSAERANTCAGCPQNKALPDGCSSCKAAVTEMRRSIIGGRNMDPRIHACAVTGEDLVVSGWIEQQRIDNPELPGHCWRKRQL